MLRGKKWPYLAIHKPAIVDAVDTSPIFELPYCSIGSLTEAGIAKRQTASQYLRQWVEIGVLAKLEAGREKLFVHPKLLQLLTRDGNEFTPYGRQP